MQRYLSYFGVVVIILISLYNNFVSKPPNTIYYALFVVGAGFILLGSRNKR